MDVDFHQRVMKEYNKLRYEMRREEIKIKNRRYYWIKKGLSEQEINKKIEEKSREPQEY